MKNKSKLLLTVSALIILGLASFKLYSFIAQKPINNMRIAVVFKDYKNPTEFWKVVQAGIETAAKEYGLKVEFTGGNSENDVDGQIMIMRDLINRPPDAIVLVASDSNRLIPVSQQARKKGIRLVTIDSGINSEAAESLIATNNFEAGVKAGEKLCDIVKNDSQVAIINYAKSSTTAVNREQGIKAGLSRIDKNLILPTLYCDDSINMAYLETKIILGSHPNLGGIAAMNENAAIGVAKAVKELRLKGKVKVVGFDNSIDEVTFIEEGVMQATIVQKPFNMGYLGIKTAVQCLKNKPIDKMIDTGSQLITLENMYSNRNQELLFPFINKN